MEKLISGSHSELETPQFSAELGESTQILYEITSHSFVSRNMQKSSRIKILQCEGLQELQVNVDKKSVYNFHRFCFQERSVSMDSRR